MMPPDATAVARRAVSLLALTALLLFQLLSRADLALVDLAQHEPGILCTSAGDGAGDGSQDPHRTCAIACAMVCHAQILLTSPGASILRLSQALVLRINLQDTGSGHPSSQSLRIRGPPEPGLV